MSGRLYLTKEQLIELTECHQVRTQQRALREAGYPFEMKNGQVLVKLSTVQAMGGCTVTAAESGPNWDAWGYGCDEAEPARETALYRHWDAQGRLLYVGISMAALQRQIQHATGSHWFPEVVKITIERFSTRGEARQAEILAIRNELPRHNLADRSQ